MSFNYYPRATKVAERYQNFTTGENKYVLDEHGIIQFKTDTDEAFKNVASEMQRLEAEIHSQRLRTTQIYDENQALASMLKWINLHFPEAIQALDSTMKVTVKLDEANDYGDITMEAP